MRFMRFIAGAAAVVALAASIACNKGPKDADLFIPGVTAAGIQIGVDDSAQVLAKLGTPEYVSHLAGNGTIWMYPKLGMGVQFRGIGSIYHSPLDPDTTVAMVMLFPERAMDGKKFEMCKLKTPGGITLQSIAPDFIHAYGEPPYKQVANGRPVDDQMTGILFYPGMIASFREGKINMISLPMAPVADSSVLQRVLRQPIVPAQTLGGITIGMTMDQVRSALGETRLKYKKLGADFWFYPQYSIKVQFGIPPKEGQRSQQYFDSSLVGKVTGITGVSSKLFEGQLCPQSYAGTTPEGLAIDTPGARVRELLGDPVEFHPKNENGVLGGYAYYVYPGIVYFIDPVTETIHHVEVTDTKMPIELPM